MSNYNTSFNINQAGNLYALDTQVDRAGLSKYTSSRATTINAPLNYRKQMLYKGFDNEFFYYVKTQNSKPLDLRGMTINATIINAVTNSAILSRKCEVVDYNTGLIMFFTRSEKVSSIEPGLYEIVLSYTDTRGLTKPLFSDTNMRPGHVVEVTTSAGYIPLNTQATTSFIERNEKFYGDTMYGPGYYDKSNGLVTIGAYATDFSGNFFIEGTASPAPEEDDWFKIELGVQDYFHLFTNFTGIEPFSFQSNLRFLRPVFTKTNGSLDKLVIRV